MEKFWKKSCVIVCLGCFSCSLQRAAIRLRLACNLLSGFNSIYRCWSLDLARASSPKWPFTTSQKPSSRAMMFTVAENSQIWSFMQDSSARRRKSNIKQFFSRTPSVSPSLPPSKPHMARERSKVPCWYNIPTYLTHANSDKKVSASAAGSCSGTGMRVHLDSPFFINAFIHGISRYDKHNEVFYMRVHSPYKVARYYFWDYWSYTLKLN
jgi:hypothetical protein